MTKLRLDAGSIAVEPFVVSPDSTVSYDASWITDEGPLPATSTCQGAASCDVTCTCAFEPLDA